MWNKPDDCPTEDIHALMEQEHPTGIGPLNAETILGNRPVAETVEKFLDCTARRNDRDVLRVGDTVAWRHGWGTDAPRWAKVIRIEIDCNASAENGENVQECSWEQAQKGTTVVDLDTGSWAYGTQIYQDMESAEVRRQRPSRVIYTSGAREEPDDYASRPEPEPDDGNDFDTDLEPHNER